MLIKKKIGKMCNAAELGHLLNGPTNNVCYSGHIKSPCDDKIVNTAKKSVTKSNELR